MESILSSVLFLSDSSNKRISPKKAIVKEGNLYTNKYNLVVKSDDAILIG